MEGDPSAVSVAVRVRPLMGHEKIESAAICIACDKSNNMLTIGKDRQFVFDKIFDMESEQV